jgi:PIN domain nuclease of toxin-antitoxin system
MSVSGAAAPPRDALLLDTHVWLWAQEGGHPLLSPQVLDTINAVGFEGVLWLSAISVWEIALLDSRRRVLLQRPVLDWVSTALGKPGARLLPLEPAIAVESNRLPGEPHGDPTDRILMASARVTGAPLVTCDGRILQYAAAGHVPVLDARA